MNTTTAAGGTRPRIRVAAVQFELREEATLAGFLAHAEFFIRAAADYRADFVLFPELFTTPLLTHRPHGDSREGGRLLAALAPELEVAFRDMAVYHKINVVAGSTLVEHDGLLYNEAWLCRRDGTIGRQEKLHVTPNERAGWDIAPGRSLQVFDTDAGRVSVQICYEVEFPEVARAAKEAGAELILVPYCTDGSAGHLRVRACAQARCIENEVYVALAGTVGNLRGVAHMDLNYARSAILTPSDIAYARDGVAAEAEPTLEMMIVADLDLDLLRRHHEHAATHNWRDRRRDLFG